ncbi:TetR/AcrR family transcriptional regulator [Gordonia sp. HY285]|uniref:TetR/AcrR family transcriptional regulator n=1 Tax=Gordonia liuliyuniae TaxID=2911517 RepID=UPI001F331280|nr:TetR/AcrR family transcriptional regulator [Gordonia liuliyuniae]MCF8611809.1 TetR/AcrR family transcriptional regulator [Gordonia liuliyuniae]
MSAGAVANESDSAGFRMQVVAESIRLFAEHGYEATTVDAVAAAAGVSRRTLFRQFRSKEDFIFADHEQLMALVAEQLAAAEAAGDDPWWSVCLAAEEVFAHFAAHRDLATGRYRVVSQVPALRDRELVTTYRYQRLFEDSLRRRLPDVPRVRQVAYAAAVTGAHNHLLRQMVRGDAAATADALRAELRRIHASAVMPSGASAPQTNAVTVVAHGADLSPDEIADIVRERLTWHAVP